MQGHAPRRDGLPAPSHISKHTASAAKHVLFHIHIIQMLAGDQ